MGGEKGAGRGADRSETTEAFMFCLSRRRLIIRELNDDGGDARLQ